MPDKLAPGSPFDCCVALALLLVAGLGSSQNVVNVSAQSGGTYDLTWNSIDGGGAMFSTGGTYSLGGTIG